MIPKLAKTCFLFTYLGDQLCLDGPRQRLPEPAKDASSSWPALLHASIPSFVFLAEQP